MSARLRNPASGDSLATPYLLDAPPNTWVSVLPPTVCVTVSSQPMFCMPLSQCVPNARPIAIDERNICFDVSPGERYQIDARGIVNDDCWGGVQLAGYRVMHAESGDTIAEFPIDDYCTGFMESKVGDWAAAYSGRDGTWSQRVVWRSLDAEMRKAWQRTPAYAAWWPAAKELYATDFADYVDSAVSGTEP